MWETLLPVVVGALIGVLGAAAGPALSHKLTQNSSKRKEMEATSKELVGVLYEYLHWLQSIRNIEVWGKGEKLEINPLFKARAITIIHFDDLDEKVAELEKATAQFQLWALEAGKKRRDGETGFTEGGFEAYEQCWARVQVLINDVKAKFEK